MKRILTSLLLVLLFCSQVNAQLLNPEPILLHFETDRAELTALTRIDLDSAVTQLKEPLDSYRVIVTGHTDSRGSSSYNIDLSQRRGRAVADFLSAKGFSSKKIQLIAEGETKPAVQNSSDDRMAMNRRVEVRFELEKDHAMPLTWMERNSVPMAKLHFQSEKGLQFESPKSGTKVSIPAGILVKKDGTPVKGEVEMQFREYRGPEDFLASGIPMHYEDERGDFFFNSGGMFEIRAFQKGEELTIVAGKTYSVSFVPTDQLASANLFLFNDTTQSWDYESSLVFATPFGPDPVMPAETALPVVVVEADVIRDNTGKDPDIPSCEPTMLVYPSDADPVAWLMESVQTGAALAQGKEKMETWFRKYCYQSDAFFLASLEKGTVELVGSLTSNFFPDDKTNTFKELLAFKDHYFESDSADMAKVGDFLRGPGAIQSNNSGSQTAKYFKSLVVRHEGNGRCVLNLNDGRTEIQVRARLRMSTEHSNRIGYDDAEEVMAQYEQLRQERQGDILNKINKWRRFLQFAPVFQTNEELCMDMRQWLDYFDKNKPAMKKRYETLLEQGLGQDVGKAKSALEDYGIRHKNSMGKRQLRRQQSAERTQALSRTLELNNFGLYNCDQIFRLSRQPEMVLASFQTPEGKAVQPMSFSLLERDSRIFFSMSANGMLYKLPGKRLDVVVNDTSGRTYHLAANDYAQLDFRGKSAFTFTVNDVTDQTKSPKDWAKLLGI